jgi:hypothetical protein
VDVIAILVFVASIFLGPGPLAAVVAFFFVVAGRALLTGG